MDKEGFVYIMASKRNGTLYIGVTTNLPQRIHQHREGLIDGFTKKYGCKTLVWFEGPGPLDSVRLRELQMKKWNRAWKLRVIEETNPEWRDLYPALFNAPAQAGVQGAELSATGLPPSREHVGDRVVDRAPAQAGVHRTNAAATGLPPSREHVGDRVVDRAPAQAGVQRTNAAATGLPPSREHNVSRGDGLAREHASFAGAQ